MLQFPESRISFKFLECLSFLHEVMTSHKQKEFMLGSATLSPLYNYSLIINSSLSIDDNGSLGSEGSGITGGPEIARSSAYDPKTLQNYHPSIWTSRGYPHDTFAVYFVRRNVWVAFYIQTVFLLFLFAFAGMAVILLFIQIFGGGLKKTMENEQQ